MTAKDITLFSTRAAADYLGMSLAGQILWKAGDTSMRLPVSVGACPDTSIVVYGNRSGDLQISTVKDLRPDSAWRPWGFGSETTPVAVPTRPWFMEPASALEEHGFQWMGFLFCTYAPSSEDQEGPTHVFQDDIDRLLHPSGQRLVILDPIHFCQKFDPDRFWGTRRWMFHRQRMDGWTMGLTMDDESSPDPAWYMSISDGTVFSEVLPDDMWREVSREEESRIMSLYRALPKIGICRCHEFPLGDY